MSEVTPLLEVEGIGTFHSDAGVCQTDGTIQVCGTPGGLADKGKVGAIAPVQTALGTRLTGFLADNAFNNDITSELITSALNTVKNEKKGSQRALHIGGTFAEERAILNIRVIGVAAPLVEETVFTDINVPVQDD